MTDQKYTRRGFLGLSLLAAAGLTLDALVGPVQTVSADSSSKIRLPIDSSVQLTDDQKGYFDLLLFTGQPSVNSYGIEVPEGTIIYGMITGNYSILYPNPGGYSKGGTTVTAVTASGDRWDMYLLGGAPINNIKSGIIDGQVKAGTPLARIEQKLTTPAFHNYNVVITKVTQDILVSDWDGGIIQPTQVCNRPPFPGSPLVLEPHTNGRTRIIFDILAKYISYLKQSCQ